MDLIVRSGKITVAVLATVVLLSCGALVLPWFGDLLTLTKSASQPWAVVTACLVEMNIIKLLLSVACIAYFGRIVEERWGWMRFGIYLALTTVVVSVTSALLKVTLYIVTAEAGVLFAELYGTGGVIVALAVAAFNIDAAGHAPYVPLLHAHVPMAVVYAVLLMEHTLGMSADSKFAVISVVFSWMYLRFWDPFGDTRGDWRAEFAFRAMFPEPLRPPVDAIAQLLSAVFGRFKVFQPPPGANVGEEQTVEAPAIADPVAERRRTRALKALNSRMASMDRSLNARPVAQPPQPVASTHAFTAAAGGTATEPSAPATASSRADLVPPNGAGAAGALPSTEGPSVDATPSDVPHVDPENNV